jgi:hypothetical protein
MLIIITDVLQVYSRHMSLSDAQSLEGRLQVISIIV